MEAEDERECDDEDLVHEAEGGSAADSAAREKRPARPRSPF
jgi:hypothetical protein